VKRIFIAVSLALLLTATVGFAQPVRLAFWNGFTGPDRPAVEALVEEFNRLHEGEIVVEMEIMPWDVFFQRLLPSFAANRGPQLVAMDSIQIPQYAERGLFAPLDEFYQSPELSRDLFVEPQVQSTEWNGNLYGMPMNFTTLLLYWNKDMFREAGLDPEQLPRNWEEWMDYAVRLTVDENGDGTPEQYGYAIADHATIPMWPILLWGNGGDVVSPDGEVLLDSPETIEAVQLWADLIRNQKISPVGLAGADADKLFQSKKAAMEVVGPWMTNGFEQAGIEFGLAMVPAGPGEQVTLGTGVAFAVNANTSEAEREAAREFFEFWNSEESQVFWATETGFPPTRTDIDPGQLQGNPYVAEFAEHANKTRFYLMGVSDVQQINANVFEPAIQRILNGGDVETVLKEAARQAREILAEGD
jgi:multiple sugar transport system substrate-binding protein